MREISLIHLTFANKPPWKSGEVYGKKLSGSVIFVWGFILFLWIFFLRSFLWHQILLLLILRVTISDRILVWFPTLYSICLVLSTQLYPCKHFYFCLLCVECDGDEVSCSWIKNGRSILPHVLIISGANYPLSIKILARRIVKST